MLHFPSKRSKLSKASNVSGYAQCVDPDKLFSLFRKVKCFYKLHVGNDLDICAELRSLFSPEKLLSIKLEVF